MPIKGLTNRGLAFPEIGKIRKGAKKTGNAPGQDLTYFRVEFDEEEIEAAATFKSIYGEQPNDIKIILPFNEIERMWDAWLEAYTAGRMVARSDGEYFTYLIDAETGEMIVNGGIELKSNQPKPYVEDQPVGYYTTGRGEKKPIFCKPSGRLKVMLPELSRAAYVTVLTTSLHDIINISEQLEAFKTLNDGRLAGIPLILRRRPKNISTPSGQNGKRARRIKWLISIEADQKWAQKVFSHYNQLAAPGEMQALPSGEYETDYDEGEIEDIEDAELESVEMQVPEAEQVEYTCKIKLAGAMQTPKDAYLHGLAVNQLEYIFKHDGKYGKDLSDAAKYLLEPANDDDYAWYWQQMESYAEIGVNLPDVPEGCKRIALAAAVFDVEATQK